MVSRRLLVCPLVLSILVAAPAHAATYYVSSSGNDASAGTATSPWRTLARVNALTLKPGDAILLRGGDTFAGG
jgi:hypothetical protein